MRSPGTKALMPMIDISTITPKQEREIILTINLCGTAMHFFGTDSSIATVLTKENRHRCNNPCLIADDGPDVQFPQWN